MHIEEFSLERYQSLYEHQVACNLTESGVHPLSLRELLDEGGLAALVDTPLDYTQTNGLDELRVRVAELYGAEGPDNVLVTAGSAEANFVAMWTLLEPGDEMVLMVPNYLQVWGIARSFGVHVHRLGLREELGWHIDLDELASLVGPRTKLIAICNPNNPTGAVMGAAELEEVAALADEAGAVLYADEIYRGAERSGVETPTCFGMAERTIVAGGLAKAYGLPGLRIGWLVGPVDVIAHAWHHHDYTTIAAPTLSQMAALHALRPDVRGWLLARSRALINANVPLVEAWIHDRPQFRLVSPEAGAMAFLGYDTEVGSMELAELARTRYDLLFVPGACYGMESYLRLGVGGRPDLLTDGLARLAALMDDLTR